MFELGNGGSDPVGAAKRTFRAAQEHAESMSSGSSAPVSLTGLGEEAFITDSENSVYGAGSQITFRLSNVVVTTDAQGNNVADRSLATEPVISSELSAAVRAAAEEVARDVAANIDSVMNE
ncbi:hypothetical protein [Nocardia sp. NPDC005366]|uniref:hypothetical protein n=1 Tax=Nocardia sp. NPDC005366 TaxID=3156878 RepID=UPI00339E6331